MTLAFPSPEPNSHFLNGCEHAGRHNKYKF